MWCLSLYSYLVKCLSYFNTVTHLIITIGIVRGKRYLLRAWPLAVNPRERGRGLITEKAFTLGEGGGGREFAVGQAGGNKASQITTRSDPQPGIELSLISGCGR